MMSELRVVWVFFIKFSGFQMSKDPLHLGDLSAHFLYSSWIKSKINTCLLEWTSEKMINLILNKKHLIKHTETHLSSDIIVFARSLASSPPCLRILLSCREWTPCMSADITGSGPSPQPLATVTGYAVGAGTSPHPGLRKGFLVVIPTARRSLSERQKERRQTLTPGVSRWTQPADLFYLFSSTVSGSLICVSVTRNQKGFIGLFSERSPITFAPIPWICYLLRPKLSSSLLVFQIITNDVGFLQKQAHGVGMLGVFPDQSVF